MRTRIYGCNYWKEKCFALKAATLVDRAVELKYVGGIYVRILGAFYLRLVGRPVDLYEYLEPLYVDMRKIRYRLGSGEFVMMHVDEIIDKLLHEERVFDVALPRIMKRQVLEDLELLGPRISFLEEEIQESAEEEPSVDKEKEKEKKTEKWRKRSRSRSRDRTKRSKSRSRSRDRDRRDRDRSRDRRDRRSRSRSRDRRRRSRSRSRDRRDRDRSRDRRDRRDRSRSRSRDRKRKADDDGGRSSKRQKKEDDKEEKQAKGEGGGLADMSTESMNALRAKLGLPPLK